MVSVAFLAVLIHSDDNKLVITNACVLFDWGLIPFTQKGTACLLQAFANRIIMILAVGDGSVASMTLRHSYGSCLAVAKLR